MKNILLVEDDEALLFIISEYLKNVGYKVFQSKNGLEAIENLKENNINLIISDLIMPKMNGKKLSEAVRANEDYKDIPILILTGQSDMYNKTLCFNAGADDYVVKPIDFMDLMLRIKSLLRKEKRLNDLKKESFNDKKIEDIKNNHFQINKSNLTINFKSKKIQLTVMEMDIIIYLKSKYPNHTSSSEILEKVLEYPKGIGNPGTVRTHIRNIRNKLEEDPKNPKILDTLSKKGYILNIEL